MLGRGVFSGECEKILISKILRKNIFTCLFSVRKPYHEQVYLMGNDGRSISRNLNIRFHDANV